MRGHNSTEVTYLVVKPAGSGSLKVRDATNKAWSLGDNSLIEQVANTLSRRAKPLP